MPVYVQRPQSGALVRRLTELQAATRPGSRVQVRARGDVRKLVVDDHTDMLVRGVDRYGVTRAKLAASTLKDRRRGPGPSLIPRGAASRFITRFEAVWETVAGVPLLIARYRDVLSKKGHPFVQYHMTGATKPGTRWVLPRRDTGGITPKGWAAVKARFARLPGEILRGGGR